MHKKRNAEIHIYRVQIYRGLEEAIMFILTSFFGVCERPTQSDNKERK